MLHDPENLVGELNLIQHRGTSAFASAAQIDKAFITDQALGDLTKKYIHHTILESNQQSDETRKCSLAAAFVNFESSKG